MRLDFIDKKQFLAQVRRLARENQITPQIMLQEIVLDDILDRIASSKYRNNLVLKGGFLIASLLGVDTRSTRDIDTTVVGLSLTKESIEKVFKEIFAIELAGDVISLKITKIEDILEGEEYSGYRMHVKAKVYSSLVDVKIDISTGDVITEKAISHEHKLLLEDRKIRISSYNTETVVAEKLQTIVHRGEINTRMKDFYDLYLFRQKNKDKIDFDLVNKAVHATAKNRDDEQLIGTYVEKIKNLKSSQILSEHWKNYQKNNIYATGIDFESTCEAAIDLTESANLR